MPSRSRVLAVVLGDLGRSPRMLRQAMSLSAMGCEVDLIGFRGAELPRDVAADPRIRVLRFNGFDRLRGRGRLTFVLAAALRQIALLFALTLALCRARRPRILVVQNPPALPLLPVTLLFARAWRAPLAIDWHNFTSAMLRLRPVAGAIADAIGAIEIGLARHASVHFAASNGIAARLRKEFAIVASAVPDSAPATFVAEGHTRAPVPTIVVPTSWGPDEDFALLAEVARLCEASAQPLDFLVTGNGELREANERRFAAMGLEHVSIRTRWFTPEDYPRALANADLGLCLHRPASGVDAPIKVPEMLACGIPVAALDCPPVREQLRDGEDGFFFSDAQDLKAKIDSLFSTWPVAPALEQLRRSVREAAPPRWDDAWNRLVRPVIESALA